MEFSILIWMFWSHRGLGIHLYFNVILTYTTDTFSLIEVFSV